MATSSGSSQRDRSDTLRSLDPWALTPEEQVDRLAGDALLAEDLREAGWKGPKWDFVANILAEYGLVVIGGWLRSGQISAKCQEKRIKGPALPEWVGGDPEECGDLAASIVAKALQQFRDVILPKGLWQPAKGAALSTYFIGQCLIQYPNVAQKWINDRKLGSASVLPVEPHDLEDLMAEGPDEVRVEDLLDELVVATIISGGRSEKARRALEMRYFGYSQKEIAIELEMSETAVAQMLGRERRHLAHQAKAQWEAGRRPA